MIACTEPRPAGVDDGRDGEGRTSIPRGGWACLAGVDDGRDGEGRISTGDPVVLIHGWPFSGRMPSAGSA
jgi:pimeloyl-ACP methyl ester carboxylesterase